MNAGRKIFIYFLQLLLNRFSNRNKKGVYHETIKTI
jgi:hypothetical protein